jgi:ribonuclease HII
MAWSLKEFDLKFFSSEDDYVVGVDEAGRGPLAGPVVAAAVAFYRNTFIDGVNDSKKLTAAQREKIADEIKSVCADYSIALVDNKKIDEINILQASLLAMKKSVDDLKIKPSIILVDGNKIFESQARIKPIVKGDTISFSIAAASILAKTYRDKIMEEMHKEFPCYNWRKNKGYPTKEHIEAIKNNGPCFYHRKSFLKNIL